MKSLIEQQNRQIELLKSNEHKLRKEIKSLNYQLTKGYKIEKKDLKNKTSKDEVTPLPCAHNSQCQIDKASCNNNTNHDNCPLKNLKILIVGGLERLEIRYKELIESMGGEFYFNNGNTNTGNVMRLKNSVCCSDIIVFITSVNSHNALQVVKATCLKKGKEFCVMKETSPSRLKEYLLKSIFTKQGAGLG